MPVFGSLIFHFSPSEYLTQMGSVALMGKASPAMPTTVLMSGYASE